MGFRIWELDDVSAPHRPVVRPWFQESGMRLHDLRLQPKIPMRSVHVIRLQDFRLQPRIPMKSIHVAYRVFAELKKTLSLCPAAKPRLTAVEPSQLCVLWHIFLALPHSVWLTILKMTGWGCGTHLSTLERKSSWSHQIGVTK